MAIEETLNNPANVGVEQPSELVQSIGFYFVEFYKEFIKANKLESIEKLKDLSQFKNNKDYQVPIVCKILLDILISEKGDEFAALIQEILRQSHEQGFDDYQSALNTLNLFELSFDENNQPYLTFAADTDLETALEEQE